MKRHIPMFAPYVSRASIDNVVSVLKSGWVGEGPQVKAFESAVGKITGARYPVAVNSGTSALHLALLTADIQSGDEVITTAQTMLATTQAILAVGAKPVYADIQYETGNIDPEDIARKITPRTRAILAVDWAGYTCDYDRILALARQHRLVVIEDAAHAFGASYKKKNVGNICPYTCFSFQAIKHITTGDGGVLCVPTKSRHQTAKRLRWFGIDRDRRKPSILGEPQWNVRELGYKYHLNDIAAAIGLGNLQDLSGIISRRRAIARLYNRALKDIGGVTLLTYADDRQSAYWLYSLHIKRRRKDFCRMMKEKGVEVSVVHLRIDRNDICGGERKNLPNLQRFTQTHISLPIHWKLTDEEVSYIIDCMRSGW